MFWIENKRKRKKKVNGFGQFLTEKVLKGYDCKMPNSTRVPLIIKKLRGTIDKVSKLRGTIDNFSNFKLILNLSQSLVRLQGWINIKSLNLFEYL